MTRLQDTASSGNPLTLNEIKSQFSGASNLAAYKLGGGYVANHGNNSAIPSTGTIRSLHFLGTSKSFEPTLTTGSADTGGYAPFLCGFNSGSYGSLSITQIGKSKSTTTSATVTSIREEFSTYFDFPTSTLYETTTAYLVFSGNHTGTWWTELFLNGTSFAARANAQVTAGTYDGVSNTTYWYWSYTQPGGGGNTYNYAYLWDNYYSAPGSSIPVQITLP